MKTRAPIVLLAALVAATLAGCTSAARRDPGPGAACDECAVAEASPTVTGEDARAVSAAAAADGGQRAGSQPVQTDPGARGVNTVWNRGAGPNTNSPTTTETRSLAGAPAVNQGLILPNAASASAAIADNPAVKAILARLEILRVAWKEAVSRGDREGAKAIADQLDNAEGRLLAASASVAGGASTTNVYDLRGARVSQIVANGSKSGDGPGGAISADTGRVVSDGAAKTVESTMAGPDLAIPSGPVTGAPFAPVAPASELPR